MAIAGAVTQVFFRNDATTPTGSDEPVGMNKVDFGKLRDLLEITDFKNNGGVKIRMAALADCDVTVTMDYLSTTVDAPQGVLRAANDAGSIVFVTIYVNPTGTAGNKGFAVQMLIDSEKHASTVAGKVESTYGLKATGVVTRV